MLTVKTLIESPYRASNGLQIFPFSLPFHLTSDRQEVGKKQTNKGNLIKMPVLLLLVLKLKIFTFSRIYELCPEDIRFVPNIFPLYFFKLNRVCGSCLSCLFVTSWTIAHQVLCPWDSPSKNTGVGCHFLL